MVACRRRCALERGGRWGRGMAVRYGVLSTRLGVLVVASAPGGVCAVSLGDAAADQVALVQRRHPGAVAVSVSDCPWAVAVAGHVEGVGRAFEVPVVLEGTAFQRRVWTALREVPYGETWTYAHLAEAVGSGPRAVAQACARNRLAVVVPCHRIVRSDGSLSGYRWGPWRKAALLALERQATAG